MNNRNEIWEGHRNAFLPALVIAFVICCLLYGIFWMRNPGDTWAIVVSASGILVSFTGICIVLRAGWWLSELRRITSNLEHSEHDLRLFRRALQTMQLGVTITNTSGRILYVNPAEATQHGYSAEELIGKDAKIFAPPEYWEGTTAEQIQDMKKWSRVSVNVRKDGTVFPVELVSGVVADEGGQPIGILTLCKDLTGKDRATDDLRNPGDRE